jgi:hypothetical protein
MAPAEKTPTAPAIGARGLLLSIILNAIIPFVIYWFVKHYLNPSEFVALCAASIFPLLYSIYEFSEHRSFDLIAIFSLLGIIVSIIGVALGGDTKILLIRESFFTAMLGVACFISLLLPRPLMFYVGRQFMTGKDPAKMAEFDARWQHPYARFVHRLITIVWGSAYVGEFIIRVILVYTFSTALVLVLSPILLGAITIGAIAWTLAYVRHAERRGQEIRQQQAGR